MGCLEAEAGPRRGYLLEDGSQALHGSVLRGDPRVDLQGLVQDVTHDLGLDERVVLGEVPVQLLDLVFQALRLGLQVLQDNL